MRKTRQSRSKPEIPRMQCISRYKEKVERSRCEDDGHSERLQHRRRTFKTNIKKKYSNRGFKPNRSQIRLSLHRRHTSCSDNGGTETTPTCITDTDAHRPQQVIPHKSDHDPTKPTARKTSKQCFFATERKTFGLNLSRRKTSVTKVRANKRTVSAYRTKQSKQDTQNAKDQSRRKLNCILLRKAERAPNNDKRNATNTYYLQ